MSDAKSIAKEGSEKCRIILFMFVCLTTPNVTGFDVI